MLLQPPAIKPNREETIQKKHLQALIQEIVENFSTRIKSHQIFLWARLDSHVGFKLQFRFFNCHVLSKGSLIFLNGCPVPLPQIYWEILIEKLESRLSPKISFQIQKDQGNLFFQLELKIDDKYNLIPTITQSIQSIISILPFVHSQLALIGIVKKNNLTNYKYLSKKLSFTSKIVEILQKDQQQEHSNIFKINQNQQLRQKGTVFQYYDQISQINIKQSIKNQQNKNFTPQSSQSVKIGGYFEVQKKKCQIKKRKEQNGEFETIITDLAVKTIKKQQKDTPYNKDKTKKQIRILNQIENPLHSLVYWVQLKDKDKNKNQTCLSEKNNDSIYMQYVEQTLYDRIYYRKNSLKDVIDYSKQIFQAVDILHKSGIVHRDLKPDNFLIQTNSDQTDSKFVKIIDFAESSLFTDTFSKNPESFLGATLPYSPIQCYIHCEQGFNSNKIDVWSIGLIAYEILNKKNPLSYSRSFAADIYRGWKIPDQFNVFPKISKKRGLKIIELVFSLMLLNSVCVNQKQRINLHTMKAIIESTLIFFEQMVNI